MREIEAKQKDVRDAKLAIERSRAAEGECGGPLAQWVAVLVMGVAKDTNQDDFVPQKMILVNNKPNTLQPLYTGIARDNSNFLL